MNINYLDNMLENIRRMTETYNDMVSAYNDGKPNEEKAASAALVITGTRDRDSEIKVSAVSSIAYDLISEKERMENHNHVSPFVPNHTKIPALKSAALDIVTYCDYVTALASDDNHAYSIFAKMDNN